LFFFKDIELARELFAFSPEHQKTTPIYMEDGVDLVLGGHDHVYWLSDGISEWEGFERDNVLSENKNDTGKDVLVIKSGSDFKDISDITLTLQDTPPGSVRKKVITKIKGK
jgi:5'-nucleotidase